jgi:hypothetical protein
VRFRAPLHSSFSVAIPNTIIHNVWPALLQQLLPETTFVCHIV